MKDTIFLLYSCDHHHSRDSKYLLCYSLSLFDAVGMAQNFCKEKGEELLNIEQTDQLLRMKQTQGRKNWEFIIEEAKLNEFL